MSRTVNDSEGIEKLISACYPRYPGQSIAACRVTVVLFSMSWQLAQSMIPIPLIAGPCRDSPGWCVLLSASARSSWVS